MNALALAVKQLNKVPMSVFAIDGLVEAIAMTSPPMTMASPLMSPLSDMRRQEEFECCLASAFIV